MVNFESAIAVEDVLNLNICICYRDGEDLFVRNIKNDEDFSSKYRCNALIGEQLVLIDNTNPVYQGNYDYAIIREGELCRIALITINTL